MTEWRPIQDCYGMYEVSNDGQVRSWLYWSRDPRLPRIKAQHRDGFGYPSVHLTTSEGKQVTRRVHKLLMEAFVGPCPEGMEVRHLDGDPANCTLGNLSYGTKSQNQRDRLAHGTHNNAGRAACKYGHSFSSENIYWTRDGRRNCQTCRRERDRRRTEARRQARLAVRL